MSSGGGHSGAGLAFHASEMRVRLVVACGIESGWSGSVTARGAADGSAGNVVYLHVGAPKTGTTYVQNVLWKNREALAAHGILYPLRRPKEHRLASLDLQQRSWGGRRDPAWNGAWDRLASRVREWPGHVAVISNELLGGATPAQAQRAVDSLQPAEVHVVFTARDLARQLVSDWQEQVKHTHTVPSARFIDDLATYELDAPEPFGHMFWGLHDAVRVLGRWGAAVPPERIHLVTVPQPGAPMGLLWERFAGLVGIEPARYDARIERDNASMGVAETELLRRINVILGRSLGQQYDPLVRASLAEKVLAARPGKIKIEFPEAYHPWILGRSKEMIAGVEAAGYDLVGDLDDLVPQAPDGATPQPHEVAHSQLLDAAIDAAAGALRHSAHTRLQQRRSAERARQLEQDLERRRRQPIKTLVRDLSQKHPALMRARVLWWHSAERVRAHRRRVVA